MSWPEAAFLKRINALVLLTCLNFNVPVWASDWVDGDTTMFPQRPARDTSNDAMPSRRHGDDSALTVTDPGAPGTAPSQQAPRALHGSVLSAGFEPTPDQTDGLTMRMPAPAPPQTQSVPAKVFQGWLSQTHPELGLTDKSAVVSIKGKWDDSSHILHNFHIPFTRISANQLGSTDLSGTKVLVVDCAGNLTADELKVVGDFVHQGGYLITTDWALDGCLSRAVPGYVMWNAGYSPSELVDARAYDAVPELFRGAVPRAYWKLDSKCQTVRVLQPDVVRVLVRSRLLARDDPDQQGILALTFPYGKGRVLHLVGHFDNNSDRASNEALPDPAPGIGISLRQAIAANFVVQALEQSRNTTTAQP